MLAIGIGIVKCNSTWTGDQQCLLHIAAEDGAFLNSGEQSEMKRPLCLCLFLWMSSDYEHRMRRRELGWEELTVTLNYKGLQGVCLCVCDKERTVSGRVYCSRNGIRKNEDFLTCHFTKSNSAIIESVWVVLKFFLKPRNKFASHFQLE